MFCFAGDLIQGPGVDVAGVSRPPGGWGENTPLNQHKIQKNLPQGPGTLQAPHPRQAAPKAPKAPKCPPPPTPHVVKKQQGCPKRSSLQCLRPSESCSVFGVSSNRTANVVRVLYLSGPWASKPLLRTQGGVAHSSRDASAVG